MVQCVRDTPASGGSFRIVSTCTWGADRLVSASSHASGSAAAQWHGWCAAVRGRRRARACVSHAYRIPRANPDRFVVPACDPAGIDVIY